MGGKTQEIYGIYKSREASNRDEVVLSWIMTWSRYNIAVLQDGFINDTPVFSRKTLDDLLQYYMLTKNDITRLNTVHRLHAKQLQYALNKDLKTGLLISYIDSEFKNKTFIVFLMIVTISELLHVKYFTKVINPKYMRYAIDNLNPNHIIKVAESPSISFVIDEMLKSFDKWILNVFRNGPTDKVIAETQLSLYNRLNQSIKSLYDNYKRAINRTDIILSNRLQETEDRAANEVNSSFYKALEMETIASLADCSGQVLTAIGLIDGLGENVEKYLHMLKVGFNKSRDPMIFLTREYIKNYQIRNPKDLSLQRFQQRFLIEMRGARKLDTILRTLEMIVEQMAVLYANAFPKINTATILDRAVAINYVRDYILMNTHMVAIKLEV